ncbi:lysophospholipase [Myxococcota bacterium]|nr:lysophospholipase [Myxococcota bacterium]
MLEHSIQSADGTRLRLVQWSPEGSPRGEVLLVHGLAEHAGRYGHVAAALTAAGHRVTFVELRGHGQSEGKRGAIATWEEYVADLQAAAAFVRRPVHLVAHSMGGLVALDALRGPLAEQVRTLALSNPLTGVAVVPPRHLELAKNLLSRLTPRLALKNPLDPKDISRDPEVVRAYQADPLVFTTITPRWATEMEAAIARVHAHAGRYALPLLAMVGTADRICDHQATLRLATAWGHRSHTEKVYEGYYHELFNEPEKATVLADLVAWLGAQEST